MPNGDQSADCVEKLAVPVQCIGDAAAGRVMSYIAVLGVAAVLSIATTQLALLVTTVYLHRYLAHGGVQLRPEVRAASRILIWITSGMKPRQWARVHRHHHATEDTAKDPHSPVNFGGGRRGARYVLWHNGPLYTQATHDTMLAQKYGDLVQDDWDRRLFDHGQVGVSIGIALLAGTMGLVGAAIIGGWMGVAVGALLGLVAAGAHAGNYLLAGGAINGYGHASSVRARASGHARNMPIVAWMTVGEGWHRNHHTAENSPRFGLGHQIDLGWFAIRALCGLKLARLTARGQKGFEKLRDHRPDGRTFQPAFVPDGGSWPR